MEIKRVKAYTRKGKPVMGYSALVKKVKGMKEADIVKWGDKISSKKAKSKVDWQKLNVMNQYWKGRI